MRVVIRSWWCSAVLLSQVAILCSSAVAQQATSESLAAFPANLGNNPMIRVLISDALTTVCITPTAPCHVRSHEGRGLEVLGANVPTMISLVNGEFLLRASPANGQTGQQTTGSRLALPSIVLESETPGATVAMVGWRQTSGKKRIYEGHIELHSAPEGTFVCVATLPLEEYLRGVVPSEIGSTSPREALCAQAVAARSEAVRALTSRVYAGSHHDICASSQCQVYSGLTGCSAATDAAVVATRGWILSFGGKPLPAYYSSNCGGHTEDIRNVWSDRYSERAYWDADRFDSPEKQQYDLTSEEGVRRWLEADPVCYCNPKYFKMPGWAGGSFRWKREVKATDLSKCVAEKKNIGRVLEIRPVRRGPSGRLTEVEFVGENGRFSAGPELAIRRIFPTALRSSAFIVDAEGGSPARPEAFVIRGAGNGHGVGMCQTGAIGMANAGKSFREILHHYYPNATLARIY